MATLLLFIFGAMCLCAHSLPSPPPITRNTIFLDEKLEDQIFEDLGTNDSIEYNVASDYRLPNTTRPIHYNILWAVDMTSLTFQGKVDIQLVANQANVTEIILHTNELRIDSLNLQLNSRNITGNYREDTNLHFLIISPSETLQYNALNPVIYDLAIEFSAPLRNDMYGIYRSWFRNSATETPRYVLVPPSLFICLHVSIHCFNVFVIL